MDFLRFFILTNFKFRNVMLFVSSVNIDYSLHRMTLKSNERCEMMNKLD
jgi:hypothetical protein